MLQRFWARLLPIQPITRLSQQWYLAEHLYWLNRAREQHGK